MSKRNYSEKFLEKSGLVYEELDYETIKDTVLDEDEYLFKYDGEKAFITKMNQNGTYPVKFDKWNGAVPVYKIKQEPVEGWKYERIRMGMSTLWVVISHPTGFMVEINATNYINIANKGGVLDGGIFKGKRYFINGDLKLAE